MILLAAGRGSRFGGAKLGADLAGKPLARHAADRLAAMAFTRHIAVCSTATPELPGFERLLLDPVDAPLSRSIAMGIAALDHEDAALIALADMPLVTIEHFQRLLEHFDGDRVGTRVGNVTMVPAMFGARRFAALKALDGDRGAGALLRDASAVTLDPALALDVDTPDDLAALQGL
nr:nucleotidyltransferase family protein [Novosphingobium hassiacum]